jgi:hypothetical protein
MGADFIIDYTYWKQKKGETPMDGFNRHVETIIKNIGDLKVIPPTMEEVLGTVPENLNDLKNVLAEYLDELALAARGERTGTFLQMGPYVGFVTGGESWGDNPSEAYKALEVLHAAGVIDLPK